MVGASNNEDDVVLTSSNDALGPDATILRGPTHLSFSGHPPDMRLYLYFAVQHTTSEVLPAVALCELRL